MAITTYAKWSTRMDRWVYWDIDDQNLEADRNVRYASPGEYQRNFEVSAEEEYFRRFGSRSDIGYGRDTLNNDTRTNPALLWNGETSDTAVDKPYGRPVPPSAASYVEDH